ncbi:Similar to Spt6: Transcription elongation factor SPT6 (Drosophila melanogaster) [Cotesia congregata]|uniref:Similar to Spt6: Transcription elongation factor SPT6 (Drosophila melanogaster) n=1 Tax=Cotesia congregata TaxID=51543 RepID=A0A8J2HTU1_COTCN|nr:Similar to Spt6: Transcription elongation factor SPT6 (Drosophila melanogaster) [Cotesia congregata]
MAAFFSQSAEQAYDEDDEFSGKKRKIIIHSDDSDNDENSDDKSLKSGNAESDDDNNFDDRLEDEDYDLLEENLGVPIQRRRFKRLKRMPINASDDEEEEEDAEATKQDIATGLFNGGDSVNDGRSSSVESDHQVFDLDNSNDEASSDENDFIVDNNDRPLPKRKRYSGADSALNDAREIFGINYDFNEFNNQRDEDTYEEEDEDEEDTGGVSGRAELQQAHYTDFDHQIRSTDIPERMQLRATPITPVAAGSDELDQESEWIYKQAFSQTKILQQVEDYSSGFDDFQSKGPESVEKIKNVLNFMRNQHFEVPFILFYRKEEIQPDLNINDLWKIYQFDAKWCQLRQRKNKLIRLFENMKDFQLDEIIKYPDQPLPDDVRIIKENDIEQLKNAQTDEDLKDAYNHFMLYYSHEISAMQTAVKLKAEKARLLKKMEKRKQQLEAEENGEDPPHEDQSDNELEEVDNNLKHAIRRGPYTYYRRAGLCSFAKKFGLMPEQFAENLRDNYQRHEVDQDAIEPSVVAEDFLGKFYQSTEQILKAVTSMVAIQLAREPILRKSVREMYMERAKISVRPTKKGFKQIDENHHLYTVKYLKDKPIRELVDNMWLKLLAAEKDGLIKMTLSDTVEGTSSSDFIEDFKQLYVRDEFSKNVQDWNDLRKASVELAFKNYVIPDLKIELRSKITTEAVESIIQLCCRKLSNWIKFAPYTCEFYNVDENNDTETWKTTSGIRSMGISYVPDSYEAAFAVMVAPNGDVVDHLKLPHLLKRKNSYNETEKLLKESDLLCLKNFIGKFKPHVIVVSGASRDAQTIVNEVRECLTTLSDEEQYPAIQVEICDPNVAKVYSLSNRGVAEFSSYPPLLREAISLARRLQDPLGEFSQLCNSDEDLLCLKFHPLQDLLPKEELLENLYREFVNKVNEVGVDLSKNRIYNDTLLQFVCGLGPRKSRGLLKILKDKNTMLENRTQLVTVCHMGPKVFINCSGFIKVDTTALEERTTDAYIEPLDSTRIHPETYEWARKMAVDAMEYEDENSHHVGAVEEVMQTPEKLLDLDLDAFATELEKQGFGNKTTTLYSIRTELTERYKDPRSPYESPSSEELFTMLTKESAETFYVGKLINATVIGFRFKKPDTEQRDQTNPVKNDETELWECPFCTKNDFPELADVWNHFDEDSCPGKAIGIRLRLDNGLSGHIHVKNISDQRVENPEDRVQIRQTIMCRVTKVDMDRFSGECSSKSSDLTDENNTWRPAKDSYYDLEAEEEDNRALEEIKKDKQQVYVKRVIIHPSFYNISFAEAEKMIKSMKQGEAIIRPSSKGTNHLSVTWKVTDDIFQHIDVVEEEKSNVYTLGRSLWIGTENFDDLDEIIARYVNVMAGYVSEILESKYYNKEVLGFKDKAQEILKELKKNNPTGIPYIISASKNHPGKFLLSYLPREKCYHEYITVTSQGFQFRNEVFNNLDLLVRWFKKHYRDPIVETPQSELTPKDTPSDFAGLAA